MEITKEHLIAARAAGACASGVRKYKPGKTRVGQVEQSHLEWADEHLPHDARAVATAIVANARNIRVKGAPQLAMLASDGEGFGHDYGLGHGDGHGDGHTYGCGADGYSYGYCAYGGYAHGDGNGYGEPIDAYGWGADDGSGEGKPDD